MFHFYAPPVDFEADCPDALVARVAPRQASVRALLAALGVKLAFPPWFGKNMDAFWDCVRDLDVPQRDILIVHEDVPPLEKDSLLAYMALLRDAALYWRERPDEHTLAVWFPLRSERQVRALLAESDPPIDPE